MLDLYWHEIPCPDDRAIRKFLWFGAFHDGLILSASRSESRSNDMTIRVEHGVLNSGTRCGVYQLRFHGVMHLECAGNPLGGSDRIYDTLFLDSAALHQEQSESDKPLYHLRIQTWSGCIDLIFERFTIRLEGGRVNDRPLPGLEDGLIAANRERHIRQTCADYAEQLRHDPHALDDVDLDEYHACGLFLTAVTGNAARTAAHAREVFALTLKRYAARAYAAHLLGLHGTADDLPALTQLLLTLPTWERIARRRVLDAMARLHERSTRS